MEEGVVDKDDGGESKADGSGAVPGDGLRSNCWTLMADSVGWQVTTLFVDGLDATTNGRRWQAGDGRNDLQI
ncbi:hypothetical protein ACLOJK_003849 [Asimina triloba]